MSNAGVFPGTNAPRGWQNYRPILRALGASVTQPILQDERNSVGRFLITNQGLVKVFAQITFASGDTLGSGDSQWGITLPFPANRGSGGADLPIGSAFLWQGAAANPSLNLLGQVSLCDPQPPLANNGQEDLHCQIFLSEMLGYGTATLTSGTTAVTVTHGLAGTPNAYDIHVALTNSPSTNPQWWWVDTITSTQFNINVKSSATTTPATFSWKLDAFPSNALFQLVGSTRPWLWSTGHSIGLTLEYEARR